MVYSIDMRERAVTFVRDGGSQVEACRLFGVSRKTLYLWLQRKHQVTLPRHRRAHKIDPVRLAADVASRPDALLRERCEAFGVTPSGIGRALLRLRIVKKNDAIRRKKSRRTHMLYT